MAMQIILFHQEHLHPYIPLKLTYLFLKLLNLNVSYSSLLFSYKTKSLMKKSWPLYFPDEASTILFSSPAPAQLLQAGLTFCHPKGVARQASLSTVFPR